MDSANAKALGFVDEVLSNKKRRDETTASQSERMASLAMAKNKLVMAEARRKQLTGKSELS